MMEARAKFLKDFPNATASELAAVPRDGKSLEQKAALNKLTEELRRAEKAAVLVQQMKDRYTVWEAAEYPADDVMDVGIAIGLTV